MSTQPEVKLICLNGTYGVQFGNRRTRQFRGARGKAKALRIKRAVLAGDLSGLTQTIKTQIEAP